MMGKINKNSRICCVRGIQNQEWIEFNKDIEGEAEQSIIDPDLFEIL